MHSIKIIGAGSIGNHIAHASASRGWTVTLTDIDPAALERTKTSIYPGRYGSWNDAIRLKSTDEAMADPADVVFIGTPPDTHIRIANAILDRMTPKAIVLEKPLCGPDLAGCAALSARIAKAGIFGGVGYNHVLGLNTVLAEKLLATGDIGTVSTISSRTREHWGGIFRAHPWLSGPSDTYLGFASRGGGATGEHSHAINIWQHFAHRLGAGKVKTVSATLDMVQEGGADYDRLCLATLTTTEGLTGDVIQDVVTAPVEKSCRIQGSKGFIDWRVGYKPGHDAVLHGAGEQVDEQLIAKTRADDFKVEIEHLEDVLAGKIKQSPISLERGLDTMMVIAAIFKSHREGRRVTIDWNAGYDLSALH
ncbi:MAG: Gfo/Idh/MocA family oxidoreductase [Hyphomicrobiales bacterium]